MAASPSSTSRVGAIDIGTNTIALLVAHLDPSGRRIVDSDRTTVTRLGKSVDGTRRLAPDAMARSLACLKEYAEILERYQVSRVDAVGTSALRDADNATEFLDSAEALIGVRPRVIDGSEEALLTCRGALDELAVAGPFVVFDIGGGSTEFVVGEATPRGSSLQHFASLDIGCVRLTERHLASDPPTVQEMTALREDVRAALNELPFDVTQGTLVGVAGTMTTLCAVHLGLSPYDPRRVHGARLSRSALDAEQSRLSQLTAGSRRHLPGLGAARSDIIVAGAVIATEVLEKCHRNEVVVSDHGVRYGLSSMLLEP
ncbi:MAG: Ppx/GppA phosphatase family protein [Polyangiaceae bacterium]